MYMYAKLKCVADSQQKQNGAWVNTSVNSSRRRYKCHLRYFDFPTPRHHTDCFVGFLVKLDCVLLSSGLDKKLDSPPISASLHHKEVSDRMLDFHGSCVCLHRLDSVQQHLCLRSRSSVLDKRERKVYQPVCYVVVSSCQHARIAQKLTEAAVLMQESTL